MAAPAQSPLRRWKRFYGAFDSVDAAIEGANPVLSRDEFRRARGDIVELLCNAGEDDHAEAERLCLVLDDLMAESLETLRLIPAMPTMIATTDLAKSVRALRKHESEHVRVLAGGIISMWRASFQNDLAKVREAMKKLDNVSPPKEIGNQQQVPDARTKQPVKIVPEPSAKKRASLQVQDNLASVRVEQQVPADARTKQPVKIPETFAKKTVQITKRESDPAVGVLRGDHHAELCSEERLEAAKRKFQDRYKEAEDAKRQRRTQVVESPEMLKKMQRRMHPILKERSRARCGGSMVKKTFTVARLAS